MKSRWLCSILATVIGCCFAGARKPPAESVKPAIGMTSKPIGKEIVRPDNAFGFKLFSELFGQKPEENIFMSPTSIAMALSMAYNGAAGKTKAAMAKVLGIEGIKLSDVGMANAALLAALRTADPKVQLEIANSLWVRKGLGLSPKFVETNTEYYEAKVTELDFADPEAPDIINGWVKEKTRDKIDRIAGTINPDDVLFLINAVYFKGSWAEEFDTALTQKRDFHLSGGSTIKHPMMSQSGDYKYYSAEGFQVVNLPYGEERISMMVFLPAEESNLAAFVGKLNSENWNRWLDSMKVIKGDIVIPKFKLEYEKTLNDVLSELDMKIAFDPAQADFSKMVLNPEKNPLFISQVKHKSFVEVNEEGTEAAAVTSVVMTLSAAPQPEERFSMIVDRPFFFAIQDNETRAVLFTGAVSNPE